MRTIGPARSMVFVNLVPIFAIGRAAGWLAHWMEQLNGNRIFRPAQIFVGKADADYVPLEKRA